MKVALCFSGIIGGEGGKNGKGESLGLQEPYKSIKENLLDVNNIDVFMHSWSLDAKSELIKLYNPKKYKFEKQIEFDKDDFRKNITKSRFYGNKMALNLKNSYELENNFKYDWVMISRFDLIWFSKLIFSGYNNKCFYASNWNDNGPNNLGPYDRQTQAGSGLLDLWFFSNSNNMDKFAECCETDFIDKFINNASGNNIVSGHRISKAIVDSCGFELRNIKYRGFDHEVYRRCKKLEWRVK